MSKDWVICTRLPNTLPSAPSPMPKWAKASQTMHFSERTGVAARMPSRICSYVGCSGVKFMPSTSSASTWSAVYPAFWKFFHRRQVEAA